MNLAPNSQTPNVLPSTGDSLPVSLIRAREAVMAPIRKMLLRAGITEQQWRVLRVLSEHGKMDAGNLAKHAALLPASLSRIVQSMETGGYLVRETDANDRRRQHINITDKGQSIINDHLSEASEIAALFRDVLGDKDHDALVALLQKLVRSLEDEQP
ncbi:MarR family transcriptional regulator [Ruegeria sp. ANG-S4]|uniref:MarR family transcriptional regulator n=1 Tax=Ruegeria sp. ANG-S4 TaxID=1577904 RepID=UPI0006908AAF|nr:MarR family transcriptional regulator [Ruegeria sp. ANG-S4]